MPRRRRQPWKRLTLGLALAGVLGAPAVFTAPAWAQDEGVRAPSPPVRSGVAGSAKTIYYKSPLFRIPVTIQPEVRGLVREVRLWVSDDYGYHWREFGQASPDRPEFPFRASRDGEYWFALQTVDTRGKIYPADDRQAEPSLKVVVDTAPPTIVLEPAGRRGSVVAARWQVQDEHLLLKSLVLEFQPEGADPQDWTPVPLKESDYKLAGSKTWDARTADAIRIRASVRDRAGNVRSVEQLLRTGMAAAPGTASVDERDFAAPPPVAPISARSRTTATDEAADPFEAALGGAAAATTARRNDDADAGSPLNPAAPAAVAGSDREARDAAPEGEVQVRPGGSSRTLLAGSPKFPLQYEVEDAGPGGVTKVQLWVTHDGGRSWFPQPEDPDKASPYPVDVGGEGTFGLWLAVQGVSGLGDPPPAQGDRPQLWVEVDSTPPVVQVDPPRVGTGNSTGKVLITWRASDPHLGARPVTLSYRAQGSDADSGWNPLTGRIENNGQYIWTVPPGTPPRFQIRVEVEDELGHKGAAESGPVLLDRARPKGRIIGLDPTARTSSDPRR